jgi:hypothetical protein
MQLMTPPGTPGEAGVASPGVQFATPPAALDEDLDADHDDNAPLRFRTVEDITELRRHLGTPCAYCTASNSLQ